MDESLLLRREELGLVGEVDLWDAIDDEWDWAAKSETGEGETYDDKPADETEAAGDDTLDEEDPAPTLIANE